MSALQLPHPNSLTSEFITLSLGVATITPDSQSSAASLIAAADQGLYQAKAKGRNCAVQMEYQDL
ncbi:MAG: diguanylate cyclase domain-containing protein [Aulosira sp. ZfuVER01]|nr:GGDEF domain-containing protein [Aulosira sp. ZfuVER01]MDZ7997698.1 GGDEF domain-containing protein [Aulosira sp. DedVER01a]MDZ8052193.1 GGDEF domain-containing protein [Aulosira sp. ZfuCHP01]